MRCSRFRLVSCGLVLVGVLGMSSGCASYRLNASLKPSGRKIDMTPGMTFNIAEAVLIAPTNVAAPGTTDFGQMITWETGLATNLMAAAMANYPDVFTDADTAEPLKVTITRSANECGMGADGCVSCISLTIIPLRYWDKTHYSVTVAKDGVELGAPVSFSREETGWLSILPTGWIPVPGGTGERVWGTENAAARAERLMLDACAEAVATSLRKANLDQ